MWKISRDTLAYYEYSYISEKKVLKTLGPDVQNIANIYKLNYIQTQTYLQALKLLKHHYTYLDRHKSNLKGQAR